MRVKVSAPVHPTERLEKVLDAVEYIFPAMEFKESGGVVSGVGNDRNSLVDFKERLKNQQIRDTARGLLRHFMEDNKIKFRINKQAACKAKINFVDFDVALGPIEVLIEDENPQELVEWLCE
ncbi:MAG: hypothetical protein JXB14_02935 [Candidatus Altiarchaeota archaeon]|nr:hypothetical protein [Candidatus Altiarchaeota archaeon]